MKYETGQITKTGEWGGPNTKSDKTIHLNYKHNKLIEIFILYIYFYKWKGKLKLYFELVFSVITRTC